MCPQLSHLLLELLLNDQMITPPAYFLMFMTYCYSKLSLSGFFGGVTELVNGFLQPYNNHIPEFVTFSIMLCFCGRHKGSLSFFSLGQQSQRRLLLRRGQLLKLRFSPSNDHHKQESSRLSDEFIWSILNVIVYLDAYKSLDYLVNFC